MMMRCRPSFTSCWELLYSAGQHPAMALRGCPAGHFSRQETLCAVHWSKVQYVFLSRTQQKIVERFDRKASRLGYFISNIILYRHPYGKQPINPKEMTFLSFRLPSFTVYSTLRSTFTLKAFLQVKANKSLELPQSRVGPLYIPATGHITFFFLFFFPLACFDLSSQFYRHFS
jgi:hypothetical protein